MDLTQIYRRLNRTPEQLAAFCEQHHIIELSLFGSVLRDDFRTDSDIDILVVFDPDPKFRISLMDLVQMEYQLEDFLRREVDLAEKRAIESDYNWIRRQEILNSKKIIYESRSVLPSRSGEILTDNLAID